MHKGRSRQRSGVLTSVGVWRKVKPLFNIPFFVFASRVFKAFACKFASKPCWGGLVGHFAVFHRTLLHFFRSLFTHSTFCVHMYLLHRPRSRFVEKQRKVNVLNLVIHVFQGRRCLQMRRPGVPVSIEVGAHLLVCCNIVDSSYCIFLNLYCEL